MKRLAMLLVAVAIFGLLPFAAFADDNATDNAAADDGGNGSGNNTSEVAAMPLIVFPGTVAGETGAGEGTTDEAAESNTGAEPSLVGPAPSSAGNATNIKARIRAYHERLRELRIQKEQARQAFVAAKEDYKAAKANISALRREARAFLKQSLAVAKERLQKLKENNITYAGMDADISYVTGEATSTDTALTGEQIVEKAKGLQEHWQTIKAKYRHALVLKALHTAVTVTKNADGLYNKLVRLTTKLKENGTDVSAIEAKLTEYKEHIDDAAVLINETISTYFQGRIYNAIQAGNLTEASSLMSGAMDALNEIKQDHLREAHTLLKEIASDLRALLGIGQGQPIKVATAESAAGTTD